MNFFLLFLIFAVILPSIYEILSFRTFTKCPKCNREFRVSRNLKYGYYPFRKLGSLKLKSDIKQLTWEDIRFDINTTFKNFNRKAKPPSGIDMIFNPSLVICPNCGNRYNAPEHKYLGWVRLIFAYTLSILIVLLLVLGPLIFILILIFYL